MRGWEPLKELKREYDKQTHISRLEKVDSDHLLSFYQKAAQKLGAYLAIVPDKMTLIPKRHLQKLIAAHA